MNEQEVLEAIADGDSAYGLLLEKCPSSARRFQRLTTAMMKLLDDVKKEFPDACYYTASGGMTLMIGCHHDEKAKGQPELVALSSTRFQCGDGDF